MAPRIIGLNYLKCLFRDFRRYHFPHQLSVLLLDESCRFRGVIEKFRVHNQNFQQCQTFCTASEMDSGIQNEISRCVKTYKTIAATPSPAGAKILPVACDDVLCIHTMWSSQDFVEFQKNKFSRDFVIEKGSFKVLSSGIPRDMGSVLLHAFSKSGRKQAVLTEKKSQEKKTYLEIWNDSKKEATFDMTERKEHGNITQNDMMGVTDIPDWNWVEGGFGDDFDLSTVVKPDHLKAMWEKSPISHLENVSAPTLLLLGKKDLRAPMSQGLKYYQLLKARKVPVRLYQYDDNHQLLKTPHDGDVFIQAALWFYKHSS